MDSRFQAWFGLFALMVLLCGALPAQAQVRDPKLRWRTLETEHFDVHYPTRLAVVARRAAQIFEETHTRLTQKFNWQPLQRVHVVLSDEVESANGSARPVPYDLIRLFVTAPDDLSTLSDYDDWLRTLITHEYTHTLHLDQRSGLHELINRILGKTYAPNQLEPTWVIEGLATYTESAESSGGRLRSSLFDMYMRAAVLEDATLRIDQLSHSVDQWPRGNTWYLYGSKFVDYIVERFGENVLSDFGKEYGHAAIPYQLNRSLQKLTGYTFVDLYKPWLADLKQKYTQQADVVRAQGLVIGKRLTHHGELVRAPRFIDNERLVYFTFDQRSDPKLRTIDLRKGKSQHFARVSGTAYPAVTPDGAVFFNSQQYSYNVYLYNDLYRKNIDGRRKKQLTHGMRIGEVDVSPDQKQIVLTRNDAGTRSLWIAELANVEATMRPLLNVARYDQVYTPRYSPDGKSVALSLWRSGGYRDIAILDLQTGALSFVTNDRALDTSPAWSPDGKTLYFSSDRSGIPNIYAHQMSDGGEEMITNVINGAYHPALSPDGKTLVYVGYTHQGFDLFSLPLAQAAHIAAAQKPALDRPQSAPDHRMLVQQSNPYRAARSVYPRAFALDLTDDAFGKQLGIIVKGSDAVGFHSYRVRLGISLEKGYTAADVSYTLNRSPSPITLRFSRDVSARGGLIVNGQSQSWLSDRLNLSFSTSYPILRAFTAQRLFGGYGASWIRQLEDFDAVIDPNAPPPVFPFTGRFGFGFFGWSYSDARRYAYDISAGSGRSMSVSTTIGHIAGEPDARSYTFNWAFRRYIRMPWQSHILAFAYTGGKVFGSDRTGGLFSTGGFPDQSLQDVLLDQIHLGGIALRGYAPFSDIGRQLQLLQAEYRFPIWRVQAGPQTVPFYFNRLYASVFTDYGDAYNGGLDFHNFRIGSGAELFLDFTVGYEVAFTLRTGFAYGFNEGGGSQFYTNLGFPF